MQLEEDQEVEDASGLDTHFDNAEVGGKSLLGIIWCDLIVEIRWPSTSASPQAMREESFSSWALVVKVTSLCSTGFMQPIFKLN